MYCSKDRTSHLQNDSLLEQDEQLQADSLLQQEEQQMCTKVEEQDTLNSTHTQRVEARPQEAYEAHCCIFFSLW